MTIEPKPRVFRCVRASSPVRLASSGLRLGFTTGIRQVGRRGEANRCCEISGKVARVRTCYDLRG